LTDKAGIVMDKEIFFAGATYLIFFCHKAYTLPQNLEMWVKAKALKNSIYLQTLLKKII
jgi:hypothetical protein